MKRGDLLFVYGTLMKGERADITTKQIYAVAELGPDFVNGKLFHIGSYPGLKIFPDLSGGFDNAHPTVKGEVYLLQDSSVVALLDAYEGYDHDDPKRGLYDRRQIHCRSGRLVWVYTFNPPVRSDQLIETGDWRNPRLSVTRKIPLV